MFLSRLPAAFAAAGASSVAVMLAAMIGAGVTRAMTFEALLFAPLLVMAAFVVALPHAMFIGLPLYALTPLEWRRSIWTSLVGAFLVGAIPMPLTIFLLSGGMDRLAGGKPSGLESVAGYMGGPILLGLFGAVGGFVFWWLVDKDELELS